jgi:outer membrane PBP1 activator LpoA protein
MNERHPGSKSLTSTRNEQQNAAERVEHYLAQAQQAESEEERKYATRQAQQLLYVVVEEQEGGR